MRDSEDREPVGGGQPPAAQPRPQAGAPRDEDTPELRGLAEVLEKFDELGYRVMYESFLRSVEDGKCKDNETKELSAWMAAKEAKYGPIRFAAEDDYAAGLLQGWWQAICWVLGDDTDCCSCCGEPVLH
jgi:hypothetical protein